MAIRRKSISSPRATDQYTPAIAISDARRIAEYWNVPMKPFVVPEGIASALGISVDYVPLHENISGYLKSIDNEWTIGVNSSHHPNRQRFTLAHELGHYFLHRDKGDFQDALLFRQQGQFNADEVDANNFAAGLLMNEETVRSLRASGASVPELASAFRVSQDAIKYRLKGLGLPIDA
jgi:hypothetical protein